MKSKTFFITFKALPVAKNCLRPYSAPLRITQILKECGFKLHKLHSNNPRLEKLNECDSDKNNSELSYGKQQLRSKSCKTKTLRIHWNKARDKFEIRFPIEKCKTTKRDI